MKLTTYFIKHPVIAVVFNFMLVALGVLCFYNLSVREYPDISFPTISVSASYPNASPEMVETTITNVLEDRLAGIEGLENITSQSNVGNAQITLLFTPGTSMDRALAAVSDAVGHAKAMLPPDVTLPEVQRQRKSNGLPFIGISLESSSRDFGELTHYANLNIKNAFRSVPGVASVSVWGQPYTYKISVDPKKLYSFGVNVDDIITAISKSRVSLPTGNYQNKIPGTLNYKLGNQEDYENLLIKPNLPNPVFLKSLAEVRLETDNSQMRVRVNGHTGLVISVDRANDANPLDVSKQVRLQLASLQQSLPDDMQAKIIIDQSEFIKSSLKNIRSSITEAIILVLLIVFIFLRNVRATIIPLVTIPISLMGSLLFLKLFGFSINLMTLLAMVLAIGLVVDDAIIVLENIWRHIEEGLSPFEAAIKGAGEIGFAIVAMTLTLASVYIPIAFMQGMLGQLFIEFAVALAGSVIISGIAALTLSPMMCTKLLKVNSKNFWPQMDHWLSALTKHYEKILSKVLNYSKTSFVIALLALGATVYFYKILPHEIAPKEDRSLIGVFVPALAGEDINNLDDKMRGIEKKAQLAEASNQLMFMGDWGATVILPLKPHSMRKRSTNDIVEALRPSFSNYPSLDPYVWTWDNGLPGIDNAGSGDQLDLVISTTENYRQLFDAIEKLKKALDKSQQFESVNYDLRLDAMGYTIELDRNSVAKLGLQPSQIAKTIEVFFSGDKSQTFEKDGVAYALTIKGDTTPWSIDSLYVTSPAGKRISLGAIAQLKLNSQPTTLDHYQQMRSTTLHLKPRSGLSMAKAVEEAWKVSKSELPGYYQLSWTGAAKSLNQSSHTMLLLIVLSLVFIYAILTAQFENFVDPLIILFTVPLACSGALLCAYWFGQTLNIYTQVGLITLIGLISKHGILIVEFANQLQKEGLSARMAVQKAASLRLRPIIMTTGAMVFGAIPLVLSHDAGAEARHAMGSVLIGGLSFGTLFTLFILPSVYSLIKNATKAGKI